jgi:hypothetical protein
MNANKVEALRLVGEHRAARAPGGRVIHDVRGNAKWDWAVSTGVLATKTVAELINTLDVPALSVEQDAEGSSAWGDPYNSSGRRF